MHCLEGVDKRWPPHKEHLIVAIEDPPSRHYHQPFTSSVKFQEMAEQLGLQERPPKNVHPVCSVQHQHDKEHEVRPHAGGSVEELKEVTLDVAFVVNAACIAKAESNRQLLHTSSPKLGIHQIHGYLNTLSVVVDPVPCLVVVEPLRDLRPRLRGVYPKTECVVNSRRGGLTQRRSQFRPPHVQAPGVKVVDIEVVRRPRFLICFSHGLPLVVDRAAQPTLSTTFSSDGRSCHEVVDRLESFVGVAQVARDRGRAIVWQTEIFETSPPLLELDGALDLIVVHDHSSVAPNFLCDVRSLRIPVHVLIIEEHVGELALPTVGQYIPQSFNCVHLHEHSVQAVTDRGLQKEDVGNVFVQSD
mmetsp:Transcript_69417/g.201452  ORF Transcript_69417/g.201452 Transcript_69417/m.201452 type:complete len:358 (-) Transcript_69417:301-1374(-)